MFPGRVARLAQPPGIGREQEVPLAAAVSAPLSDTIAAQLHCAVAVTPDVHPLPAPGRFGEFSTRRALATRCPEKSTCVI